MPPASDAAAEPHPRPARPRGPGRPRRSSAEREAQRTRLLDAAFQAIREHGAGCSIEQMAAAAGVSKPVIHGEFGGKSGIAEAIALRLTHQIESQALAGMSAPGGFELGGFDLGRLEPGGSGLGASDLETGVRLILDALVTTVTDEPAVYAYLVRSLRSDDRGLLDNALVTTLNDHTQVILRVLAPDLDRSLLTVIAHGTFGFVFAAIESWQTAGTPSRQALIDALATIIVQAFTSLRGLVPTRPS